MLGKTFASKDIIETSNILKYNSAWLDANIKLSINSLNFKIIDIRENILILRECTKKH